MRRAAQILNCKAWEVDEAPVAWKLKALAYAQVEDKTKPALEALATERAKAKAAEEARNNVMGQGRSEPMKTRVISIGDSRRR